MSDITMDIASAESESAYYQRIADKIRDTRTIMKARAQLVVDVWKCDAEMEFQYLHDQLLLRVDTRIKALEEIRAGLDEAIRYAKIVDQSFQ